MSVTIEKPILNSPFEVPARHWRITDDGITDDPVEGRRKSAYFIPVPPPRKKGGQLSLDATGWTAARMEENDVINLALNPGRTIENVSDEDLLREAMNTIGKPGRLGEQIRCVVSVSMLTEGWDANTVTHILGVRAFRTQLLCEQVVGRGLRRVSYVPDADGRFSPEYAEVYGVPFQFLPTAGTSTTPTVQKEQHRVHALAERAHMEQTFPRLTGYRYELPRTALSARFVPESTKELSTHDVPTTTEMEAVVGESAVTSLDDLRAIRLQQVEFELAKRTLDSHLLADDGSPQPWLFPQVLRITRAWLRECVVTKDHTFPQLLLLAQHAADAAGKIDLSIARGMTEGEARVLPILRSFEPLGTTSDVDFTTTKPVYRTSKSHLSHFVQDSHWESKVAQVLEDMDEVICYAKNDHLGLRIPYTFEGRSANYLPDIIIRIDTGDDGPLDLLVEVTGERRKDKQVKVDTARTLWIPAVDAHGGFGRWSFYEVTDPWDAEHDLHAHIRSLASGVGRTDHLPMTSEVRER